MIPLPWWLFIIILAEGIGVLAAAAFAISALASVVLEIRILYSTLGRHRPGARVHYSPEDGNAAPATQVSELLKRWKE